ncbi:hypothetical protein [Thalassotalea montiporae]
MSVESVLDNNETKIYESIERIEFASKQFNKLIGELTAYSAAELEPIVQQMLTVESAGKELDQILSKVFEVKTESGRNEPINHEKGSA